MQIREKREIMSNMGVDFLTIKFATEKAIDFAEKKGPFTEKQLKQVFPAALILVQSNLLGSEKLKGMKLTERQVEEIFGTNRKTTRKMERYFRKVISVKKTG